jgi:Cu+-exporting ATPase
MTSHESLAETSVKVVDPVCGMKILPEKAAGKQEYEGQTYYFCGQSCIDKFKANPASFLASKPTSSPVPSAPKAGGYTCPMHPEVHKDGPGDCPKCGMALEPETMSAPATRTQYTCPMHPQIIRDEPGNCPICGMALEPMTVTVSEANPELDSMTRRFWIGAALTLPSWFRTSCPAIRSKDF